MFQIHTSHILPIFNGEKALFETGYEIRFGDESSSIIETDTSYNVVAKISKFDFSPNHHYWLILEDPIKKELDIIERISYKHVTESYGYLYNNQKLDSINVGDTIPSSTILRKSLAFDEYMNRTDGVNFNVAYMSLDKNMEDSIIFSDVAAKRLTSPLIKPVKIMINENDIPLNLYGNDDLYKCIPDIGEDIKDSVLIALRKEKKEESVYAQSVERLRHVMMSDESYTLTGKVIDVNIMCNNVSNLDTYYNGQFKMYYNQLQRSDRELVSVVTQYQARGYTLTYDLQKKFAIAKQELNHTQYIDKKIFSNIILEVTVLEERELMCGDKTSNRYGGKGVVSHIIPQKLMPRFGDNEYVDVILNSNGIYGRENPGQLFELSISHIGCEIIRYIKKNRLTVKESFDLIIKYISFMSQEQADDLALTLHDMTEDEKEYYLNSVLTDGAIQISEKPISEPFSIDKLNDMYKTFPFVNQNEIIVPMRDSNGNVRYIFGRRKMVIGKQYTYRLKQYAEEKFSATSLSATNIRNENTKSKAARDYKELYSNTPIRFGNMETNDLNHLGAGYVIQNLMIHSLSPKARRLTEQMFICNPYDIDIKLDDDSSNRAAEICNVYLKTIGRRLIFEKHRKVRKKITITPIYYTDNKKIPISPIFYNKEKNFNWDKDWNKRLELSEKKKNDKDIAKKQVIVQYIVNRERRKKQWEDERDYNYRKWEESVKQNKLRKESED